MPSNLTPPGMARRYHDLDPPGMARRDQEQRQGIRRTALVVGGIAVLIYAAFILSGVIGR